MEHLMKILNAADHESIKDTVWNAYNNKHSVERAALSLAGYRFVSIESDSFGDLVVGLYDKRGNKVLALS